MARLARPRAVMAYAVWTLCVVGALVLAGGALLVALKADPGSVWGWWLEAADLLAVGWFDRPEGSEVGGADVRQTLVRWGSGATVLLLAGALLQWLVRPRRG